MRHGRGDSTAALGAAELGDGLLHSTVLLQDSALHC